MSFPGTPAPICSQEEGKGFARLGCSKLYRTQPGSCKTACSHHLQETSFCKSPYKFIVLSPRNGLKCKPGEGRQEWTDSSISIFHFCRLSCSCCTNLPSAKGETFHCCGFPSFSSTSPCLLWFFFTYWNNLRETHPGIKKPGGTITAIPRASWLLSSPQASEKIRVSQHKSWARLWGADTGARFQLKLIQAR